MGVWEENTTNALKESLQEGQTFVDVGAHIGYFSVLASLKGCRVFAFEPDIETFSILADNLNPYPNSYPFLLGVSNVDSFIPFYLYHSAIHTTKKYNDPNHIITGEKKICVVRLDDFFREIKVDAIKIDVQGIEWEVLDGARELIKRDKPILVVEDNKDERVTTFLNEMGYGVEGKDNNFLATMK